MTKSEMLSDSRGLWSTTTQRENEDGERGGISVSNISWTGSVVCADERLRTMTNPFRIFCEANDEK